MVGPISTICFDAPRPNQGDVEYTYYEALCKFCSDPYNLENSLLCEDPAYFIMGRCSQKYMDVVGEYGWTCPTELAKYHLELYNPGSDQDETVRKLTAIIPKFFCVASFFGSAYIVWELYKHRNQKLRLAFNRLLLVLSIFDMISSFAFFFGDWAIPETAPPIYYDCSGSPWDPAYGWPNKNHSNHLYGSNVINGCIWANYYDSYFLYSSGTQGTCTLQGTLIQIGALGSVLATGATALTCMLTVRYDWREKRLRQFEKMFFPFLIIFPIGSAIYLAFAGYFNPTAAGFCYISPYPWDLWWPFVVTQTPSPSYRGIDHWEIFQVIFAQLWVALVLLIILVSMGSVYLHVANQERRSNRWTIDSPSIIQSETRRQSSTRRGPGHRSQLVLEKGMMYIGAYLFVYIPVMIAMLKTIHWPYIDMVVAIIMPCQGILNVLIYGNKLDWIKKGCNSCSRDGCSSFSFGTSNFFASALAWYNSTKWGLSAKFPLDFFLRNTKKEQIQEFHKGEQDITDSGETPGIKNDSTNSGNKPGSSTEEEDGFPKKEMDNDGDSKVAPTTVKAQLDYLLQMPAILEKSEMVEEDVTAELPETTTEGCFEPASATGTKLWSTCISNEVVDA